MSWDKTQPQGSTKLRNLGDVINPNWAAIETADDTFKPIAVNLDKNAVDRTAIADAVITYNKNNELYAIDPSSVVTKLTGGSLTAAANGHLLLPNGFKMNWGIIASNGSTAVSKTFESAFTSAVYSITLTPVTDNGTRTATIVGGSVINTKFSIKSSNAGMNVYYMAIGK